VNDDVPRCSPHFSGSTRDARFRVLFPATGEHGPGYPGESGVVVDYRVPKRDINLNRPRLARLLIELALGVGWSPVVARGEFVVPNGFHLLREHSAALDAALAPTTA
jgi:hypothetical protein